MGYRIHTAPAANTAVRHSVNPANYFDDEEMAVGPALIFDDKNNLEALTIVGTIAELHAFAHRILDALPVALTDDERAYLTDLCEDRGYSAEDGSIGRTFAGWAFFTSDEDATTFDLTNGQMRAVEYDEY